jgi:hypothetical protein
MKTTHFLLAQADSIGSAVKAMEKQLNEDYADKNAMLQQIFLLPEIKQTAIADKGGNNQLSYSVNLVAVITEEPEWDNLQRNYKPVFDKLVVERETLIPIIENFLNSLKL